MAKGSEEEYVVLSKVRVGHKREFQFAMRSQNEISSVFLGRTRARNVGSGAPSNKKLKKTGANPGVGAGVNEAGKEERGEKVGNEVEEDPKSDVVDGGSDDENRSQLVESERREKRMAGLTEGEDQQGDPVVEDKLRDVMVAPLECEIEAIGMNVRQEENGNCDDGIGKEVENAGRDRLVSKANEGESRDLDSDLGTDLVEVEVKLSKGIPVKMVPQKLKDLLQTGLLEGLPVRYIRGFKNKAPSERGLPGAIKGSGILCFCDECKGTQVVTPSQFELHAGSSNKRPPEYIFLENGNTLRDVLNACKDAKPDALEVAIETVVGHSIDKRCTFCLNCKGPISGASTGRPSILLCDVCTQLKASQATPSQTIESSYGSTVPMAARKSSKHASKASSSATKSQGRITRKDLGMHKLVFEDDILPDGTEVGYYLQGEVCIWQMLELFTITEFIIPLFSEWLSVIEQKLLSGYKKGLGIFCMCCQKEVSPSQFEAHAGCASRRKPYDHIYTSNGVSLHELALSLSKERRRSIDENDDLCSICSEGGDLLCCDGCPRSFHIECIPMRSIPQDTWFCRFCENMFQKERSAERSANAIAAGRLPGVDAIGQITKRCIRIVKTLDPRDTGCALCRAHDFSKSGFGPRTVIICDQCEQEFHVGCLREHKMQFLKELPKGTWFCSFDCNRIHRTLQELLEHGEQLLPDHLIDMIKKKCLEKGLDVDNLDIKWRIFSGRRMSSSDEVRVLLSKAVCVFHEKFNPIINGSSQDLVPHIVYGRNAKNWELGGMLCAVLEVNSIVVSAAVFRIFGTEVAELPLAATTSDREGQGYFQSLYFCIERLLGELNVKRFVLPAAAEAKSLWTHKFGFSEMSLDELNEVGDRYNLMGFDGTTFLGKPVPLASDPVGIVAEC